MLSGARTGVTAAAAERPPGITTYRRSMLRLIAEIIRNPLNSVPPACFEHRMVLTRNLGRLRAYISDPDLIHEALVRNADRLGKSEEMKQVLGTALGEGLLTADGATWRWQRQALAPAFQHERLVSMLSTMIDAATATRERWLALPRGSTVDLGHEMMRMTFAIILETMLSSPGGMDVARIERGVADYLGATSWMFAMAMLKAPRWMPFPGRARAASATQVLRGTVEARIAARRQAGNRPDDLVGMLLAATDPETGRSMSDGEITDNILTFIAAGHETTAVALSWTFALLAKNPDCAARLRAEIDDVTGGGPVLPQHTAKLTYARQVFNEAMRLYPPAPIIARTVARAFEIEGVELPVGSIVLVPIYAIHRHRRLWTAPDAFDPDRFAPDAARARHRFAFMPFGAGQRICIGSSFAAMEAVAILAVLAKAVTLLPVETTLPEPQMRVTLRPERAIRMLIESRSAP